MVEINNSNSSEIKARSLSTGDVAEVGWAAAQNDDATVA
jgi:hypothetical protein